MEKFDFIIFGASGLTGKCTIEEAVEILKDFKWAAAGRNKVKLSLSPYSESSLIEFFQDKIEKALIAIGSKKGVDLSQIPVLTADCKDESSLLEMVSKTKVLLNCAGPLAYTTQTTAKACIEQGVHYVDVACEPYYLEKFQLDYNEAAKSKGVYVVSGCGIFSVFADIGTIFVQENFKGIVNSVESYFECVQHKKIAKFSAAANYGSARGLISRINSKNSLNDLRSKLVKKNYEDLEPKLKNRPLVHKVPVKEEKYAFEMKEINTSVVNRTQQYFYENFKKRPVQIKDYFAMNYYIIILLGAIFLPLFSFLLSIKIIQKYFLRFPKIFSFGILSNENQEPSEEMLNSNSCANTLYAEGWKDCPDLDQFTRKPVDKTMVAKIVTNKSAYHVTGIISLLCSLTILKDRLQLPEHGGVYTPGVAFHKTKLIQRLQDHGIKFNVSEYN